MNEDHLFNKFSIKEYRNDGILGTQARALRKVKEKEERGYPEMFFLQTKGGRQETTDCMRQEGKQMIKEMEANANTKVCQRER